MPPIERRQLNQKAVLWAYNSTSADGSPLLAAPVEISVRWEHVLQTASGALGGGDPRSGSVFVADAVAIGSILWLGKLTDKPASPTDLYSIDSCDSVPNIKGRITQYSLAISWFGDTLPALGS